MKAVSMLSMKEKRGNPYLFIENQSARRSGFEPGLKFVVEPCGDGILLRLTEKGDRKVSRKEQRSGAEVPVIDINSSEALSPLKMCDVVRIVYGEGQIYVSQLASERRRQRRLARVREHVGEGAITTAGLAFGGGILSHAVHQGAKDQGLAPSMLVANEIRGDLLDHAAQYNPVIGKETVVLNLPMQEVAFDEEVIRRLRECDLVDCGIPCSGASIAGKAKNKNAMAEDHEGVGHLVAGVIAVIARLNPVAVVFECVTQYAASASASILRKQLRDLGYTLHETTFLGTDWGALEARTRWAMVAMTQGIEFDVAQIRPEAYPVRTLGDIMEPVPDNDSSYSEMAYLKDKAIRDKLAGKGFSMQVYNRSATSINTLTAGMAKRRSTDPFFSHPTNPDLLRLPTVLEHCRIKGCPEELAGPPGALGLTRGHEMFGQSVIYNFFRQLSALVVTAIKRYADGHSVPVSARDYAAAA